MPFASAVLFHTLLKVKSDNPVQIKVGSQTHVFPHQLRLIPPGFGNVNVKNIIVTEIAVPVSRATARM